MDSAALSKVIKKHHKRLVKQLGLSDWGISFAVERIDGEPAGQSTVHSAYRHARLVLDPEKITDEEDALRVLRHELIHVLVWPWPAWGEVVLELLPDGDSGDALMTQYHFFMERLVGEIERLVDRLAGDDLVMDS